MDVVNILQAIRYGVHQESSLRKVSATIGSPSEPHRLTLTTRSRLVSRITVCMLIGLCLAAGFSQFPSVKATRQSDAINAALSWLVAHQLADGSYGAFTEPQTAPAAYALWIKFQDSTNTLLSYRWLKTQLQNSTTWFWGGGGNLAEADIPGEILYSFDLSNNLQTLNLLPSVVGNLTKFQQSNGGFLGYFDSASNKQVTSSVDTAMALLGLVDANSISLSNEKAGISYLLSLQNPDGSFNLTSTIKSSSLYSLGPEPVSITALVLLALKTAFFSPTDSRVTLALNYLSKAASSSFNGHVYAAALSLLVFFDFSDIVEASVADNYLLTQQNSDGGFRDIIRSSTGSNPLDTGWAAAALELGSACCSALISSGGGGRGHYLM